MKLNIGSGSHEIPGFEKWDIAFGKSAFPLDLPNDCVEEIYSSHLLEHFGHGRAPEVLKEWVRVLKPGGRIRVAVPDFDSLYSMFREGKLDAYQVEKYLMGGQTDVADQHRTIWTKEKLARELQRLGVINLKEFESEYEDCSLYPFSLNLEGMKRESFKVNEQPIIVACMSSGRLGFADNFSALENSIARAGIPIVARHNVGSAFWEKSLTLAILSALEHHNPDYILTVDYDSVWSPEDVRAIFGFMQQNPWAAAAFPVQMHRSAREPLVNYGDYASPYWVAEFGHFGLSMFRAQVFKELPHPWFMSMPGENGVWDGPGQRDADIMFWQSMGEYGYKVVRLNEIVIGHMEQAVIWPDLDKPVYQNIADYRKGGKPANVRWNPPKLEKPQAAPTQTIQTVTLR